MYKIKFVAKNEEITFDAFSLDEAYNMADNLRELIDRADTEIELYIYKVLENGNLLYMEGYCNTDI